MKVLVDQLCVQRDEIGVAPRHDFHIEHNRCIEVLLFTSTTLCLVNAELLNDGLYLEVAHTIY